MLFIIIITLINISDFDQVWIRRATLSAIKSGAFDLDNNGVQRGNVDEIQSNKFDSVVFPADRHGNEKLLWNTRHCVGLYIAISAKFLFSIYFPWNQRIISYCIVIVRVWYVSQGGGTCRTKKGTKMINFVIKNSYHAAVLCCWWHLHFYLIKRTSVIVFSFECAAPAVRKWVSSNKNHNSFQFMDKTGNLRLIWILIQPNVLVIPFQGNSN